MELYLKTCAVVLVSVILILTIPADRKEFGLLLSLAVCAMVATSAFAYLKPVISFVEQLQDLGNLDPAVITILLKSVGIGILGEIAGLVCNDAGNSSLGKTMHFMSVLLILWLSLPLFTRLLDLLQRMLGKI